MLEFCLFIDLWCKWAYSKNFEVFKVWGQKKTQKTKKKRIETKKQQQKKEMQNPHQLSWQFKIKFKLLRKWSNFQKYNMTTFCWTTHVHALANISAHARERVYSVARLRVCTSFKTHWKWRKDRILSNIPYFILFQITKP